MGEKDRLSDTQLGLLTCAGLACTVGAIAFLWGVAQAVLVLGLLLLVAAYCSVGND